MVCPFWAWYLDLVTNTWLREMAEDFVLVPNQFYIQKDNLAAKALEDTQIQSKANFSSLLQRERWLPTLSKDSEPQKPKNPLDNSSKYLEDLTIPGSIFVAETRKHWQSQLRTLLQLVVKTQMYPYQIFVPQSRTKQEISRTGTSENIRRGPKKSKFDK